MTVFINARFLCQPLSGVQRFSGEILKALDGLIDGDPTLKRSLGNVVALRPAGQGRATNWRHISVQHVGNTRGHIWEQEALFKASKSGILVSLGNTGPLRHQAQILALHDANIWDIPHAFSSRYRAFHRVIRPILARRAQRLITVSNFSAGRLAQFLDVPVEQFVIVPNGADHILRNVADPWALQRYGLHQNEYLLTVGNQSPNKNITRLIAAHSLAGSSVPPLAVVGGTPAGVGEEIQKLSARVHPLGRVGDGALRSLYENAAGFVFPSLYEGFGIPPLEAMKLGTPVLAAHRTAMPEVLKDGVAWFDPTNSGEMSLALEQFSCLSDVDRINLIRRGKHVADSFTWEQSAQLLIHQILSLKATTTNVALGVHSRNVARLRKVP